ncbi:MAG: metal ABC transporter ATP-binding protein [Helicobacteraceae bacterium]
MLDGVDLEISRGDFLGIAGPNGGGKSTLLGIILSQIAPQRGKVLASPVRTGFVPQDTNRNKTFPVTVQDVVLSGFVGRGKRYFGFSSEQKLAAQRWLGRLGMGAFLHKKIGELSGGQRQRTLIARALVGDPELLVLDEPTSGIDSAGGAEIFELLKSLNAAMTIVAVSHDLSFLSAYAKQLAFVNKTLVLGAQALPRAQTFTPTFVTAPAPAAAQDPNRQTAQDLGANNVQDPNAKATQDLNQQAFQDLSRQRLQDPSTATGDLPKGALC